MRDIIQEHVSWLHLCGVQKNLYPSAPAKNLHRMEDYAHRQCVAIFVHLSSSDDVLAPLAVCGSSSKAFCRFANFVTSGNCATIQNAVNLAKLAYGSFEVSDPLRWDVLNALKLLACFVKQFWWPHQLHWW